MEQKQEQEGAVSGVRSSDWLGCWLPVETAPTSGGAERRDDPNFRNPPPILMAFKDGEIDVVHHDVYWVYQGKSGWVCDSAGEPVESHYGKPVAWMPLPPHPSKQPNDEAERTAIAVTARRPEV